MQSGFKRTHSSSSGGGSFEGRGRGGGRGFSRTEGRGGGRGGRGGRGRGDGDRFRDRDRSASGMSSSRQWSGSYRPQVADESVPRPHLPGERSRGRGRGGGSVGSSSFASASGARDNLHRRDSHPVQNAAPRIQGSGRSRNGAAKPRDVVVILEKAGILMGNMGLVDAYDRAATTEIANASLKDVRPDIVHQCLLALFDSDLAYQHRLRVYISLFSRQGKVIEVSPALRPPRTYARFRGLMAALLRDGRITSTDGQVLMRLMPGSVAPIIPHGAEVIGLTNGLTAPIVTPTQLAQQAAAAPVDDALQGGIKHVTAFYCVSCTDDCNLDGIDYITKSVCLSAYPMTAHVQSARICEGHTRVEPDVTASNSTTASAKDMSGNSSTSADHRHHQQQQAPRVGEVFPVDQGEDLE